MFLTRFIERLFSKDTKGLDEDVYNNILNYIDNLSPEQYKSILAGLLVKGLKMNEFDYPMGVWPPPTPARAYIYDFLNLYRKEVKGTGEGITIVADLQDARSVSENYFDSIICTHVLSAIPNPWMAASELKRVLKPGGILLCTVPTVLQRYAPDPKDCWRFTVDSLREIFSDFSRIKIYTFGNSATVAGSPYYLMTYHFPVEVMAFNDENCPSIVAAALWK